MTAPDRDLATLRAQSARRGAGVSAPRGRRPRKRAALPSSPEKRRFLELAERYFRRPGRRVAETMRKALIVETLIKDHGVRPKKRAILAVASLHEFAAVERAYQKLVKADRPRFISDRHPELKAALARLRSTK